MYIFMRLLHGGQSLLEGDLETSYDEISGDDTSSNENVMFQNDRMLSVSQTSYMAVVLVKPKQIKTHWTW